MQVLQARLIQDWTQKRPQDGWTIVDLLILLVLFGILATLSLPAFSSQADIARQAEARNRIRAMNRAQQAYFLERNVFAPAANIKDLGLGVATRSQNYTYTIFGGGAGSTSVTNQAIPTKGGSATWKAYIGGVQVARVASTNELTTLTVLCEGAKAPAVGGPNGAAIPLFSVNQAPLCPAGYRNITRQQ